MDVEQPIDQVLRGRLGEHAVDERRPAVLDRMPDDAVLIGRAGFVAAGSRREPLRRAFGEIGQDPVGARALDRQQGFQARPRARRSSRSPAAAMIIEYSPLTW